MVAYLMHLSVLGSDPSMSPRVTLAVEDHNEPNGCSGVRFVSPKAETMEISGGN